MFQSTPDYLNRENMRLIRVYECYVSFNPLPII